MATANPTIAVRPSRFNLYYFAHISQKMMWPYVPAPSDDEFHISLKNQAREIKRNFGSCIRIGFKNSSNIQLNLRRPLSAISFLSSVTPSAHQCLSFTSLSLDTYRLQIRKPNQIASLYASSNYDSSNSELSQVSKRLEKTSRYFKRLGSLGFWKQLVLTIVSAVILSFSVVITGKVSSPATFYATSGGIAAGFLSVFWSFGYIRLSDRLRKTSNDPSKAPPRADVVKSLQNGIVLNLLGMGAAILGMQATLGTLVAKALTTSANPYSRSGSSPVLALDIFLVQASANVILSHFLGLVLSSELLRSVTLPPSQSIPVPKVSY